MRQVDDKVIICNVKQVLVKNVFNTSPHFIMGIYKLYSLYIISSSFLFLEDTEINHCSFSS